MSKMASDYNAINLSQGFPDFNCSPELIELVNYYMHKGFNQYAPMPGTIELRKKISEKVLRDYGNKYNFDDEITITAGATQALFAAFTTIINKGDEVIIFEPAYDAYLPAVKLNGGIYIPVRLSVNDFSIPWDKVENLISSKTKCIIINSPHNPTGTIITQNDIDRLINIVKNRNIFLISDEVYEHIVFEEKKHLSFASYPELAKKSFVISSFGKTFHTTGWKIGYCCAPENLTREFRKVHQFIVFSVNTPVQMAISDFIENPENIYSLNSLYQSKRDLFISLLRDSKFLLKECSGTYFQVLDYSKISNKPDLDFCEYLTKNIGVAAIPFSPFYLNGSEQKLIRICFAKSDEILRNAANKFSNI